MIKKKIDFSKILGTKKIKSINKKNKEKKELINIVKKVADTKILKKPIKKTKKTRFAKKIIKNKKNSNFDPKLVKKLLKEETQKIKPIKEILKKQKQEPLPKNIERVQSGITGLDELIEGGFETGSSVLIVGSAGTGKTLFGLQFLYSGAKDYKEPGIFISFEEEKESLLKHSKAFGFNFNKLEEKKMFKILQYKPHQVEKLMQDGGGPIRDVIKSMKAKRLVIDSITAYGLLFRDEYQKRENILGFFDLLKKWGCTSIIISELPPKIAEIKEGSVGFLTDAIISLYYSKEGEKGVRTHSCEILKMRGTKHTNKLLAIGFEKNGLAIYPEVEVF